MRDKKRRTAREILGNRGLGKFLMKYKNKQRLGMNTSESEYDTVKG